MRTLAEVKIHSEVNVDGKGASAESDHQPMSHYSEISSVNVDMLAQFNANLEILEQMQSKMCFMLHEVNSLIVKK